MNALINFALLLIVVSTFIWITASIVIAYVLFSMRSLISDPFLQSVGKLIGSIAFYGVCIFISRLKPNVVAVYSHWALGALTVGSVQLAVATSLCAAQLIRYKGKDI